LAIENRVDDDDCDWAVPKLNAGCGTVGAAFIRSGRTANEFTGLLPKMPLSTGGVGKPDAVVGTD